MKPKEQMVLSKILDEDLTDGLTFKSPVKRRKNISDFTESLPTTTNTKISLVKKSQQSLSEVKNELFKDPTTLN